ncbi:MAG: endopeptidase La [Candidatus Kapabacteria bacterium]|nr:endopeptidase La [Candidatus Kapabacteria bacterium]
MQDTDSILDQLVNDASMLAIPRVMPIIPARDVAIFPIMIYPILIGRASTLKAVSAAMDGNDRYIFVSSQKDPQVENPKIKDIYKNGTICKIIQILRLPNNMIKLLVEGVLQGKIAKAKKNKGYMLAEIEPLRFDYDESDVKLLGVIRHVNELFTKYVKTNKLIPNDISIAYDNINDPQKRLYFAASNLIQPPEVKQKILNATNLKQQFMQIATILASEINVLKIEEEVDKKVQGSIQKMQKKVYIQEQIRALESELDDSDRLPPELAKLRQAIDEAGFPEEILAKANEEFEKISKMSSMSPDYVVLFNYLDWLTKVPFKTWTADVMDLGTVETILNEDHYGMEKPKERILEYIAILNMTGNLRRQILCFVGPPGVGKTSLAKSIARALNRKFVRFSLGGVRDEAEIRGHRRTYIGALPGKIIQSMKKAGTVNPVILLDEIDKMSHDHQGDPASALLEVLDPEQNINFNDHYLDIDYDLSNVLFITTANVKYDIPAPLLDRMEIIDLESYLDFQKYEIATRHIIPNILAQYGMEKFGITFSEVALYKIIHEYTRESGVRNLEREISSVLRKYAKLKIIDFNAQNEFPLPQDDSETPHYDYLAQRPEFLDFMKNSSCEITPELVGQFLKTPYFPEKKEDLSDKVGIVTGLAWTSVGGDILPVEVRLMPGNGKLTLTGKLGDVMKESAMAALSLVRSRHKEFGIKKFFFEKKEIHIHFPEGAIPKDGPSAGITMTIALISAASKRKIRGDIAMTGEITLSGKILPIGGLNEKLLAAKRAGIHTILIPGENERDLVEINKAILEGLTIHPVKNIDDALKYVFA